MGHERSSRGIDCQRHRGSDGWRLKLRDCLTILPGHYTEIVFHGITREGCVRCGTAASRRIIISMEKFTVHTGLVVPLDRENVDTDAIIPKQFLKSIKKTGFGPHLFDAWRYFDIGEPGMDTSNRKPNPDFVLNKPQYQGGTILLARKNFGCGSSREHAPWALQQHGFNAVIAPSFADIFFNNSFKNGFLPIVLTASEVSRLFDAVAA